MYCTVVSSRLEPTSLSLLSVKSKLKLGSAVHSCSGGLHTRLPLRRPESVVEAHKGNCLLKAMLMLQLEPMPELETDEHVAKTMSIVPSRSDGDMY